MHGYEGEAHKLTLSSHTTAESVLVHLAELQMKRVLNLKDSRQLAYNQEVV